MHVHVHHIDLDPPLLRISHYRSKMIALYSSFNVIWHITLFPIFTQTLHIQTALLLLPVVHTYYSLTNTHYIITILLCHSFDLVLFMCNVLFLMLLVPNAGFLFEWFMNTATPFAQYRNWRKYVAAYRESQQLNYVEEENIIADNIVIFVGWMVYTMGCVSTKGNKQMTYTTLLLQYYGLSRQGIQMMSKLGYCLPLRTFDNTRSQAILENEDKNRYTNTVNNYLHIKQNPHCLITHTDWVYINGEICICYVPLGKHDSIYYEILYIDIRYTTFDGVVCRRWICYEVMCYTLWVNDRLHRLLLHGFVISWRNMCKSFAKDFKMCVFIYLSR